MVLDGLFGPMQRSQPDLWGYRAYLLIVGIIYARLSADEELDTPEIVALAKALAEQRRAQAVTRGTKQKRKRPAETNGELPESFDRIVERIYGTNLHRVGSAESPAKATGR